jgi:hypothetical protein
MTDDSLLGQLAEEFTQRVRGGKPPDIEDYARSHPELAGRVRELFPALMLRAGRPDARPQRVRVHFPGASDAESL